MGFILVVILIMTKQKNNLITRIAKGWAKYGGKMAKESWMVEKVL